jgi:hypothetical protein
MMKKNFPIKRVKASSLGIIRSKRAGCASSLQKRAPFRGRFVPSLDIQGIYDNIQKRGRIRKKRVLFHLEVKVGSSSKERGHVLKKILCTQNIALFQYEKIFFESKSLAYSVSDWSLIKRLLQKTLHCALSQSIDSQRSRSTQARFSNKAEHYNEGEDEIQTGKPDPRALAHEYESTLTRNYRISPKI